MEWNELAGSLVRLTIAVVLGALIGWERERHRIPAGLRTHILVAVASASFMMLGMLVAEDMPHADPIHIMQGVAVGIGFLGAGTILKLPAEHRVEGLTTAAGIWATAALGVALGAGHIGLAIVLALLTVSVLTILRRLEN